MARFEQSQGGFPKGQGVLRQRLSRWPVPRLPLHQECARAQRVKGPQAPCRATLAPTPPRPEGCRAHPQDGSTPAPARGAERAHIQTCPPVSFTLTSVTCLPRQRGPAQSLGTLGSTRPLARSAVPHSTWAKPQSRGKHPRTAQTAQGLGGPPGLQGTSLQQPREPCGSQHRRRIPKLSQWNTIYSGSSSGTRPQ